MPAAAETAVTRSFSWLQPQLTVARWGLSPSRRVARCGPPAVRTGAFGGPPVRRRFRALGPAAPSLGSALGLRRRRRPRRRRGSIRLGRRLPRLAGRLTRSGADGGVARRCLWLLGAAALRRGGGMGLAGTMGPGGAMGPGGVCRSRRALDTVSCRSAWPGRALPAVGSRRRRLGRLNRLVMLPDQGRCLDAGFLLLDPSAVRRRRRNRQRRRVERDARAAQETPAANTALPVLLRAGATTWTDHHPQGIRASG